MLNDTGARGHTWTNLLHRMVPQTRLLRDSIENETTLAGDGSMSGMILFLSAKHFAKKRQIYFQENKYDRNLFL